MNINIQNRVLKEAIYMLETKETIRSVAKHFKVSKSTVHDDLKVKLKKINKLLAIDISKILKNHIPVRHIRGGESTRLRYLKK